MLTGTLFKQIISSDKVADSHNYSKEGTTSDVAPHPPPPVNKHDRKNSSPAQETTHNLLIPIMWRRITR